VFLGFGFGLILVVRWWAIGDSSDRSLAPLGHSRHTALGVRSFLVTILRGRGPCVCCHLASPFGLHSGGFVPRPCFFSVASPHLGQLGRLLCPPLGLGQLGCFALAPLGLGCFFLDPLSLSRFSLPLPPLGLGQLGCFALALAPRGYRH
jgi:hypothetical protein